MAPPGSRSAGGDEELEGDEGTSEEEEKVFRVGGVTYLHIPSKDPHDAGIFYERVFGWTLLGDPEAPAFEDGTGHVIGTWVPFRSAATNTDEGILCYIYVESIDETLDKILVNGGEVTTQPYEDGGIQIAVFRDRDANTLGIWSH
jgi:predicted enzyme related to lactoylglutathione lyase